ncbi:MAG TPA: hypothetical protein VLW25_15975 [Bryobacteraceae bacterium]|nr:hypothetical protein [Bryobacteraceae bacterium]
MQQIEFSVPARCDLKKADALIERVCAAHGLEAAMKGTLATHPGSIHWHWKMPKQKGTLELTLSRADRRIWAAIHTNRQAPWIEQVLNRVRADIERALKGTADRS